MRRGDADHLRRDWGTWITLLLGQTVSEFLFSSLSVSKKFLESMLPLDPTFRKCTIFIFQMNGKMIKCADTFLSNLEKKAENKEIFELREYVMFLLWMIKSAFNAMCLICYINAASLYLQHSCGAIYLKWYFTISGWPSGKECQFVLTAYKH